MPRAFAGKSLRSFVAEQRKLRSKFAQLLQVGNYLALSERLEHAVVRDKQNLFARQTHVVILIVLP